MKKTHVLSSVSILSFLMLFSFCESTENNDISFTDHVFPIFSTNCLDCHSSDAGGGNLNLSSYSSMTSRNNEHPENLIIPGDPFNSLLYLSVTDEPPAVIGNRMPKGRDPLQASEIQIIEDWISQGAKDN